jgi:hypothetical protein
MDERVAREVLGVGETATFKDIKKAHRGLVNVFHPDRASQDEASQKRATESMSRINSAWEFIEELNSKGLLGKQGSATSTQDASMKWEFRARRPGKFECSICGSAPSQFFNIKGVQVLLVGISRPGYEGNLCKACSKAFTYEAMRSSMIGGWWGVWFFITPFVLLTLLNKLRLISKMKEPTFRDLRVITPYETPLLSGPMPFKQPRNLLIMAGGIISVAIVLFVVGGNSNTGEGAGSDVSPTSNRCWTFPDSNGKLRSLDCSDSSAVYQTLATTVDPNSCPTGTVVTLEKDLNALYTCLEFKQ